MKAAGQHGPEVVLPGIVLFCSAFLALWLANSGLAADYAALLKWPLAWGELDYTLKDWIKNGVMTLFFLAVGLEIKHEFTAGVLAKRAAAALPLLAAVGGMVLPAVIFVAVEWPNDVRLLSGWAVPTATDIAFALGVFSLVARGLPRSLRVLLLAVAVVDDVGAIVIISVFYATPGGLLPWLLVAGMSACLGALWRHRVARGWAYAPVGFGLWLGLAQAGVSPTLAGVLVALAMPAALGQRVQRALHAPVAYGIMPLFALSHAGVNLAGWQWQALLAPLTSGVMLALVVGKPLGLLLGCWLAVRLKLARLPRGVRWGHIAGIGCLAGIGFTMSLFVANLAFADPALVQAATLGVLAGSVLAATLGAVVLRLVR